MRGEQIFVPERRRAVLEFLYEHKRATVVELCERFRVSPATMRGDLHDLEREGLLVRTHGGATIRERVPVEREWRAQEGEHFPGRRAMAQHALGRIEDGDAILLDTGLTTLLLASLLMVRNDITVVTNDLNIARLLEEHPTATVHVLGGAVRKRFHYTLGSRTEQLLDGFRVDKAFMVADGFSVESGATTADLQHAEIKRRMMVIASKTFLLVDSSGLGRSSFAQFAEPGAVDCLIVDSIDPADARVLEDLGMELVQAGPAGG